jgi:methionyl aminopeptidase
MEKEILEKYQRAGKIGAGARELALEKARPGLNILELAEAIEGFIIKSGARPAFPVNISINEIAAHYTPGADEKRTIQPGDLVKIDIGVEVEGYIGDLAFTYCPEKSPLIEAANKSVRAGIAVVRPGVTVGEIGRAIEESIKSLGLGVIVNLTGHNLDRYIFHGGLSIPNTANDSGQELQDGDAIALEPFIAESNGRVEETGVTRIYQYIQDRPVRLSSARKILQLARDQYHGLPFATRWLVKEGITPLGVSLALKQLEAVNAIKPYPVLKEIEGKKIAQAEHTIIVLERPVVTTE